MNICVCMNIEMYKHQTFINTCLIHDHREKIILPFYYLTIRDRVGNGRYMQ